MKNKEYKKLMAIAIAAAMIMGTCNMALPSKAAETKTAAAQEQTVSETKEEKPFKDETVYAKLGADGTVKSVTVSDQLRNVTDIAEIQDVSSLKKIKNVKGEETFTQTGDKMIWKGVEKTSAIREQRQQSFL